MNKKELITRIAEKADLTLEQAESAIAATFSTLQEAMIAEDNVVIAGFGSFTTKVRKERKGRNPRTGTEIIIPRAIVPVFKAGIPLKESVNRKEK